MTSRFGMYFKNLISSGKLTIDFSIRNLKKYLIVII